MIEITISSELAADHPEFMAGCAERGHQVEVFDDAQSGEKATREVAGRSGVGERRLPSMRS
jgi:hypothetical protein